MATNQYESALKGSNYSGGSSDGSNRRRIDLRKMKHRQRESLAARLLLSARSNSYNYARGTKPAIVGKMLLDGDYIIMNRQPSLHKPSMMADSVRVLKNPKHKTLRMHFANCNSYNADFDGDNMNGHYPQNELSRAEAHCIARTEYQYIVPTDGTPLRGLIQDHVVGGVKLTKRDTFLPKWKYQQLLMATLSSLPGLEVIPSNMDIELLPPAIMKPQELWTGKQVITTLLQHLRKGTRRNSRKHGHNVQDYPGISCERKSKTPESAFGASQDEHLVLVRDDELLRGVLDKGAFGATDFSLVHTVYESYGPEKAGMLLNAFGRLFTAYIQMYSGHSCRVEDLVLTKHADEQRCKLVQRAYNMGSRAAKAWAESEGGKVPIVNIKDQPSNIAEKPLKPVEAAAVSAKLGQLLSGGKEGQENFAKLDAYMQSQLNPLSSDIVKKSLPSGLAVCFPYNTFGIMTTTGAKGSIVNQSQVTCALGQQALEGRRVPRMSSGRTLPSFAPYDPNPRADGFVMDRFLTGIRPQEYYMHCMAGREGLVDTAVKTSRSGYLQRCLMKHLEELKVCYDMTVRNSEGSVIQFLYGEDAIDPVKASYLDCTTKSFEYIARNYGALKRHNIALPKSTIEYANNDANTAATAAVINSNITDQDAGGEEEEGVQCSFKPGDLVLARRLRMGKEWVRGKILRGWKEAVVTKVSSTRDRVDLKYKEDGSKVKGVPLTTDLGFCGGEVTPALSSIATLVKPFIPDPLISSLSNGHRIGVSGACVSERVAQAASDAIKNNEKIKSVLTQTGITENDLSSLIAAKYSSSLCAPGEAVGCIAAQSIGEPSTQMTLNTFHLAGSGANVTLGIPRLREIIMTASKILKTPTMSVPLHSFVTEENAERITRDFSRLTLMGLISGNRGVAVSERFERSEENGSWERAYYVTLKLHPAARIKEAFGLDLVDISRVIAKSYVPLLAATMKKEIRRSSDTGDIVLGGTPTEYIATADDEEEMETEENKKTGKKVSAAHDDDDENNNDDDDDAPGEDDGADAARQRGRRKESISYDDDEEEEDDNDKSDDDDDSIAPESDTVKRENLDDDEGDEMHDEQPEATFFSKAGKSTPTIHRKSNSIALQPLRVCPSTRPLLMVELVEAAAAKTLVMFRKDIEQAFITDEKGRGKCLQIAGVNFPEMWNLESVDHDRLLSNDIWAIRCAYGVEAARNNIMEQITSVFGAYGIEVDPRHLSLIADFMTFDGGFRAMNRGGMEKSSSTLLQMTFETTIHFLRQSAMLNASDKLESPSANIVLGRPVRHGTGSFAVLSHGGFGTK